MVQKIEAVIQLLERLMEDDEFMKLLPELPDGTRCHMPWTLNPIDIDWCGYMVLWAFQKVGAPLHTGTSQAYKLSSASATLELFEAQEDDICDRIDYFLRGEVENLDYIPQRGDIAIRSESDGGHICLVTSVDEDAFTFKSIDGNMSGKGGDKICRKERDLSWATLFLNVHKAGEGGSAWGKRKLILKNQKFWNLDPFDV